MAASIAAVVVDHDAGPLLHGCVRSLLDDGADRVVVVENGAPGSATTALGLLLSEPSAAHHHGAAAWTQSRVRRRGQPWAGRAGRWRVTGLGAGIER